MTNTEIKKLVKDRFTEFLENGFELSKNILYKKPIGKFIEGYCFERSHSNEDSLYVWSFVQPLYIPSENIFLTFGKRIDNKLWQIKNNPKLKVDMEHLISKMLIDEDGFLSKINTPLNFYNYYQDKCENIRMIEAVVYSAVYSHHDDSEVLIDNYIKILNEQDISVGWIKEILNQMIYLKSILNNKNEILNLINRNIEFTKSKLNL